MNKAEPAITSPTAGTVVPGQAGGWRWPRVSKKALPYLFLVPTLAILLVYTVYPLFYSIYLSLNHWDLGSPLRSMRWVGGKNYARLLADDSFRVALKNTFVFVVSAVTGEFLLGLGLALIAVRRLSKAEGVIRSFILLPMIVTPVVVGMMWRLMYNHDLGMLNYFLGLIGVPGQSWLTDLRLVMPVVILTDIWQWTPFMFLMLLAGLSSLPIEPMESARVDGASAWQSFLHITWPLLAPTVLVAVLIRSVDAVKVFDLVYIMTFGGPGNATETLSLYAYRKGFIQSDIGYGAAVALVLTVIVTILSTITVRRLYHETDY